MSTDKIQVHFLVLTTRRKELFLRLALEGFRPGTPKPKRRAAAAGQANGAKAA